MRDGWLVGWGGGTNGSHGKQQEPLYDLLHSVSNFHWFNNQFYSIGS